MTETPTPETGFDSAAVQLILHGLIDRRMWYDCAVAELERICTAIDGRCYNDFIALAKAQGVEIGLTPEEAPTRIQQWLRDHGADGAMLIAEALRDVHGKALLQQSIDALS